MERCLLLQGTTYKAPLQIDLCYQSNDRPGAERLSKRLGSIPVMVRSRACYLRNMDKRDLIKRKEEANEVGVKKSVGGWMKCF